MQDLHKTRNVRLAFKNGLYWGGFKAGLMSLTGGKFPGGMIEMGSDNQAERIYSEDSAFVPDGKLTFSKVEGVFKSGNATRDSIPSHLLAVENVSPEAAKFYAHLCPAGVYEVIDGKLRINAPNCIDCKATDILAARWTPREAGSGPRYKRM
jgi:electron-transferring-flavoprotein dehydrogenase